MRLKFLIVTLVTMLVVLFAAAVAPDANAYVKPISGRVMTDGMGTRVDFFKSDSNRNVVTCVKIKTGGGRTRHVQAWNDTRRVVNERVGANKYTGCEASFVATTRKVTIKVVEDMLGPWNLVETTTVNLW